MDNEYRQDPTVVYLVFDDGPRIILGAYTNEQKAKAHVRQLKADKMNERRYFSIEKVTAIGG